MPYRRYRRRDPRRYVKLAGVKLGPNDPDAPLLTIVYSRQGGLPWTQS